MANFTKTLVMLLALNLVVVTLVSACGDSCGSGIIPKPPKHNPTPYTPTPSGGSSGNPSTGNCPKDALKLVVCANVLNLLKLKVGDPPNEGECCPLVQGLIDAEAAICLCTNIKLGLLGINLNIPVDLCLLVNYCGRALPHGFQCF
ncbi:hypothetical protein RND81_13G050400 [Saponaria officinalis]|uniref:Bifunctional inhibitor/plant lipid transfer protein/seed storage helical domain-containing protein n=1 Tax=Saponaria officinalis TaxID=3572 RepID=A0AAW1GUD9_SAPOF